MTRSQTVHTNALSEFALAVSDGLGKLGQRELPSMYLYDDLGSALFEAITLLPEYGLTRAELRLLNRHAGAMVEQLPPPVAVVELEAAAAERPAVYWRRSQTGSPWRISPSMLRRQRLLKCHQASAILARSAWLDWNGRIWRDFRKPRPAVGRGSHSSSCFSEAASVISIRPAAEHFLRDIRRQLQPGDALLLGTDVEKSVHDMLLAYDDPAVESPRRSI